MSRYHQRHKRRMQKPEFAAGYCEMDRQIAFNGVEVALSAALAALTWGTDTVIDNGDGTYTHIFTPYHESRFHPAGQPDLPASGAPAHTP